MSQVKTAGAAAQRPLGTPPRGPSAKLSQATRATQQGASAATANQARLRGGQVKR